MQALKLASLDISIIAIYFISLFLLSYFVTNRGRFNNSDDYFLAGKDLSWFLVGSSVFASNIGSEHLIGLAGSGASTGVVVAQFEVIACFVLLILGWFFVPIYMRSSVVTMPEFLEKRFSKAARDYLTYVSIIAYILTKISVTIYAGAIVFETLGVSFWIGAGVVVIVTGIYTIFGGLKAVIYTDALQMVVMIIGSILITYFGLESLGGVSELRSQLPVGFFDMWRPMSDPDFPWTGIIFGAPILGVWYWCTDQYVVQRVLSARNIKEARRGTIFASYLKILPLFIFVIPGMICFALSQKGVVNLPSTDMALPILAGNVLPIGIKGVFIAGLLSALMSSLSSVFNSCSTLIAFEIFKRKNPKISEKKLIRIGQISTIFMVLIGIAWIPMMKYISGELFKYIQSVQAYISPPIAAAFFLGLLWKRINSKGAIVALYMGLIIGLFRLILEINKAQLSTGSFIYWFADINFLHFAALLFLTSSAVMISISLLSKQDNSFELSDEVIESDKSYLDVILSMGVSLIVFYLWWYFS